jgi:hypothetical protein
LAGVVSLSRPQKENEGNRRLGCRLRDTVPPAVAPSPLALHGKAGMRIRPDRRAMHESKEMTDVHARGLTLLGSAADPEQATALQRIILMSQYDGIPRRCAASSQP